MNFKSILVGLPFDESLGLASEMHRQCNGVVQPMSRKMDNPIETPNFYPLPLKPVQKKNDFRFLLRFFLRRTFRCDCKSNLLAINTSGMSSVKRTRAINFRYSDAS